MIRCVNLWFVAALGISTPTACWTEALAVEVQADAPSPGPVHVDYNNDEIYKINVGHARLVESVKDLPKGSLSAAMNVEVIGNPDVQHPALAGKTFLRFDAAGISDHFTRSVRRLCGNDIGMTPELTRVQCHTTINWLKNVLRHEFPDGPIPFDELNARLREAAPDNVRFRVVTHSWASWDAIDPKFVADPLQLIRRTDAMIDRDDVLQVMATVNDSKNFLPVIANCYNGIAVGRVSKESALGPTRLDVPGRGKPDILAPLHTTSQATPTVSSAVVLLLESAVLQNKPRATKPYVIKSVLMTGAKKLRPSKNPNAKIDWALGQGHQTAERRRLPLDFRQGAGMLQVDRSYSILQQPEATPGAVAGSTGWSRGDVGEAQNRDYIFSLDRSQTFAATLVWHRHITEYGKTDDGLLNNLDLCLYRGSLAATPHEGGEPVVCSVSEIDNVEHIYIPELRAGTYVLSVVGKNVQAVPGHERAAGENYGLSWQSLATTEAAQQ